MITSTIRTFDTLPVLMDEVIFITSVALAEAARVGAEVANAQAHTESGRLITTFSVIPTERAPEGFRSGIRARDKKWRIFDKGSLGKRSASLKRDRRKESWQVKRGDSTYTARRGNVEGKGIPAANISAPARLAGRKALIAAIRGH